MRIIDESRKSEVAKQVAQAESFLEDATSLSAASSEDGTSIIVGRGGENITLRVTERRIPEYTIYDEMGNVNTVTTEPGDISTALVDLAVSHFDEVFS